jgi:hypothetical protein
MATNSILWRPPPCCSQLKLQWPHHVSAEQIDFDRLDQELRLATAAGSVLVREIIEQVGARTALLRRSGRPIRVNRLIEFGAWTEAALALIDLELPGWTVRRLVHENGEWLCSLSRQPNIPIAFDDVVETGHEALPLAILRAVVEACRRRTIASAEPISSVPLVRPKFGLSLCCDNFG